MSAAAADSFIYDETLEDQIKITPFTKKEMLYALDSNNQSYNGYSNIVILSTTAPAFAGAGTTLDTYNVRLAERIKYTSYSIPGGANNILPAGAGAVPTGLNRTNLDQTFKSYRTNNNLATAGLILQWTICATIPLKFLADFFDKICLPKGTLMNIVINYNARNVVASRAGATTLSLSSVVLTSGNSLPYMLFQVQQIIHGQLL